jgi:hypothetical protein
MPGPAWPPGRRGALVTGVVRSRSPKPAVRWPIAEAGESQVRPNAPAGASGLTTYQMRVEIPRKNAWFRDAATALLPALVPFPGRQPAAASFARARGYTWNCETVGRWRQSTNETLAQSTNGEFLARSERSSILTYQNPIVPLFAIRAREPEFHLVETLACE